MGLPSLPRRIGAMLRGRLPSPVIAWATRAAAGFEQQLDDCEAVPHRTAAETLAQALGFSRAKRELLGGTLDLLQVSFDVADNVADRYEDAGKSRGYTRHYRRIPEAALVCLPALLTSTAVQILHEGFPAPVYAPGSAGRRLLHVLGDMVVGQGTTTTARHVALVSGRQGLLLCLPVWLVAPGQARWQRRLSALESWAFRFGQTWEYRQAHAEQPTLRSASQLARSMLRTRRAWPDFSPFLPGEQLAESALIRPAVC